jgi:hypothetical protein
LSSRLVKLHGDLGRPEEGKVVIARRDYRELVYENPGYTTFLRAVFSTRTVLYLGFSFNDEYLNELRSEVLSLLGHAPGDMPIAYAVVNDVPEEVQRYYWKHEGIRMINYDTWKEGQSERDFGGFDTILEKLYERTCPRNALGRLLAGKRILWVDANRWGNEYGMTFFKDATEKAAADCQIDCVNTLEEGIAALSEAHEKKHGYDLVISKWGYEPDGNHHGMLLLQEMHQQKLHSPVVFFAGSEYGVENRRVALTLGAFEFTWLWEQLFCTVERLFGSEV